MGGTSLGNVGRLLRDQGSVGVGGEGGGDGGDGKVVTKEGVDVGGGSETSDQVHGHLSLALLPASLGDGSKVSFTGLDNVSGLGRHEGAVGVGGEGGGDRGDGHMVSKEGVEIGSGGVTGDQVYRHLGLTLLAAVHHSGSRVDVGGAKEGVVAMGGLGGVVVGGGGSNIRVEGGDGAVGVGDQVGGRVKSLCLPLAVVVDGMDKARRVNSEGVDQLASLCVGLQVGGGRCCVVWVVRGNGAIGVVHQLGRSTSNKERADYLKMDSCEWVCSVLDGRDANKQNIKFTIS